MSYQIMHPRDLKKLLRKGNTTLVDIRKREAYNFYHYPGAISIPYEEAEKWTERFKKGNTYVLYCEHGSLSLIAARRLDRYGINAYTLAGGIKGLKQMDFYD